MTDQMTPESPVVEEEPMAPAETQVDDATVVGADAQVEAAPAADEVAASEAEAATESRPTEAGDESTAPAESAWQRLLAPVIEMNSMATAGQRGNERGSVMKSGRMRVVWYW